MIEIVPVISEKLLRAFVAFPRKLYQGHNYYVPALEGFELNTLSKAKNPAFEFCDAQYWLAKKDNQWVGRIAAIINQNEYRDSQKGRFGWIDFIDDTEVFDALMQAAEKWLAENGCKIIQGPMGFTDLDFEGALIKGYDQLATQATIYNHPYYIAHYERYGFQKAVDWVEMRGVVPQEIPKKLARSASLVSSRFGLKVKKFKSAKEAIPHGKEIFDVLNKAYSHLHGFYPLTENQIQYYIKQYFDFVRIEFVTAIVNQDDKIIGFAITFPSISKALQKANGKLFPFGFIHLLNAFRKNEDVDMFLIGVLPEYQKLGANVLIFHEMMKTYIEKRVQRVATGPMLEDNRGVMNQWADYSEYVRVGDIKRRCYQKEIG